MEAAIAADPSMYPVVPETGGVRKARWARPGMGKSGGIRVMFFHLAVAGEVWFLAAYPKNEQENLTHDEKKQLRQITRSLSRAN